MPRKKSTSSGKQVTARRRRREPVPFAKKPLRMPEAEVAVVMAEWLLAKDRPGSKVKMALDGAHVHLTRPQFRLRAFLKKRGWVRGTPADSAHEWQGDYTRSGQALRIRFRAGFDLRAKYRGRAIAVECKGGPLDRAKGKGTRTILAEAIGQALVTDPQGADEVWVAVPDSVGFIRACKSIAGVSAFRKTGIRIALVNPGGEVQFAHKEA